MVFVTSTITKKKRDMLKDYWHLCSILLPSFFFFDSELH